MSTRVIFQSLDEGEHPPARMKKWPRRDGGCVDGNSAAINSSILSSLPLQFESGSPGCKKRRPTERPIIGSEIIVPQSPDK